MLPQTWSPILGLRMDHGGGGSWRILSQTWSPFLGLRVDHGGGGFMEDVTPDLEPLPGAKGGPWVSWSKLGPNMPTSQWTQLRKTQHWTQCAQHAHISVDPTSEDPTLDPMGPACPHLSGPNFGRPNFLGEFATPDVAREQH